MATAGRSRVAARLRHLPLARRLHRHRPSDCVSCHLQDYQAAADPDHQASGFSTDCAGCHTAIPWAPAFFDHSASVPAHRGPRRRSAAPATPTGTIRHAQRCYACHQTDYEGTADPDHQAAGFPTDCTQCHDTADATGSRGSSTRSWPLTGGHSGPDCDACHAGGRLLRDAHRLLCCHQDDYQGTTEPDHEAAGFPTDCTQCHDAQRLGGGRLGPRGGR